MSSEKVSATEAVDDYCTQLRRRLIEGSLPCAKKTAEILRLLITTQRHVDADALIDDVRNVGHKIQASKPVELAIGNIVRRVLHIIREEAEQEELEELQNTAPVNKVDVAKQQAGPGLLSQALRSGQAFRGMQFGRAISLSNLLDVGIEDVEELLEQVKPSVKDEADRTDVESHAGKGSRRPRPAQWKGKQNVIDSINELIDELDNIQAAITAQGVEHIHANEVILTFGMSDTTFHFLKEVSKKREFQVVVAEGAPTFSGHTMAKKLSDAGMQTTVIADAAVFAMMARANKVLVGAHAVLANGGVIAPVGLHLVALAAKRHSIPFVVLVGLHKLSPLFPHDPDLAYNEFKSPAEVADFNVLAEAFAQQEALHQKEGVRLLQAQTSQQDASSGGAAFTARQDMLVGGAVHVPSPAFDYIPPHLISLFVTDTGGYTPSYVYRLLTEYYSRQDYMLSKEVLMGSAAAAAAALLSLHDTSGKESDAPAIASGLLPPPPELNLAPPPPPAAPLAPAPPPPPALGVQGRPRRNIRPPAHPEYDTMLPSSRQDSRLEGDDTSEAEEARRSESLGRAGLLHHHHHHHHHMDEQDEMDDDDDMDGDEGDDGHGRKRKRGGPATLGRNKIPKAACKSSTCRNQTGHIGVRQRKWGMFAAEIRDGDKRRWLGSFPTSKEAGMAYDAAAIAQKGSKAKTNFRYLDYRSNSRSNSEVLEKVRWDFLPKEITEKYQIPPPGLVPRTSPPSQDHQELDTSPIPQPRTRGTRTHHHPPQHQHHLHVAPQQTMEHDVADEEDQPDAYVDDPVAKRHNPSQAGAMEAYQQYPRYPMYHQAPVPYQEEEDGGYYAAYPPAAYAAAPYPDDGMAEAYEQPHDYPPPGFRPYPGHPSDGGQQYGEEGSGKEEGTPGHPLYKLKKAAGPKGDSRSPDGPGQDMYRPPKMGPPRHMGGAHPGYPPPPMEYPAHFAHPAYPGMPMTYAMAGMPYPKPAYMIAPGQPPLPMQPRGYPPMLPGQHPGEAGGPDGRGYERHHQDQDSPIHATCHIMANEQYPDMAGVAKQQKTGRSPPGARGKGVYGDPSGMEGQPGYDGGSMHGHPGMPPPKRGSPPKYGLPMLPGIPLPGMARKHHGEGSSGGGKSRGSPDQQGMMRPSSPGAPPPHPGMYGAELPMAYDPTAVAAYPALHIDPHMMPPPPYAMPHALYPGQYLPMPGAPPPLYSGPGSGIIKPKPIHAGFSSGGSTPEGLLGAFQPYNPHGYGPDGHGDMPTGPDGMSCPPDPDAEHGDENMQVYYKKWKELTEALTKITQQGSVPAQSLDDVMAALQYFSRHPPSSSGGAGDPGVDDNDPGMQGQVGGQQVDGDKGGDVHAS